MEDSGAGGGWAASPLLSHLLHLLRPDPHTRSRALAARLRLCDHTRLGHEDTGLFS